MKKSKSFKSKWVWILICISGALFLTGGFIPAFHVEDEKSSYVGLMCLAVGWMSGLTGSILFLSWLANIFYFLGILFTLLKKGIGFYFGAVALFLAPLMYAETEVMVNEGGTMKDITSFEAGSVFWILSIAVLVFATCIQKFKKI